ncbi:MAG TPA: hypothetical protein VF796_23605 [Humisphaera sp.]
MSEAAVEKNRASHPPVEIRHDPQKRLPLLSNHSEKPVTATAKEIANGARRVVVVDLRIARADHRLTTCTTTPGLPREHPIPVVGRKPELALDSR